MRWILPLSVALAAMAVAEPPSERPEAGLEAAFANRYEVEMISEMQIVMRNRGGSEQKRLVQAVSKRIDGRAQSIGRVLEPASLRGLTVVTSEVGDGGRDRFVYLPALLRARRISGIQRLDSFLGSDLTYEDFERQRAADFAVEPLPPGDLAGGVAAIHARPPSGGWWPRGRPAAGSSSTAISRAGRTPRTA